MASARVLPKALPLAGKVAVVTGASRGLGRVIAEHFAEKGASLALGARNRTALAALESRLVRNAGRQQKIVALPLDVASEESVVRFAQDIKKRFGRVDILVNCAGVPGPRGPIERANWQEWKDAVHINLVGLVFVTRCLLPLLRKSRHGKIINISGGGATKPLPQLSAYAASKAAVVRFTETLAAELRKAGIDVNAVAPGVLATRMVKQFLELDEKVLGAAYVREVKRQMRNPRPALVRAASLCLYLASRQSDGITGRLISAVWDPWEDLSAYRRDILGSDVYTLRRIEPKDRGFFWGTGS